MKTKNPRLKKMIFRNLAALVFTFFGIIFLENAAVAQADAGKKTDLSGLASVSGTVMAPKPFRAAKVYFRNIDKRILYMVYTSGGRYEAMHLFPGNYEFTVKAEGLASEGKKIVLKAGKNEPEDVTLRDAASNSAAAEVTSYNAMYPAGPALDLAQRTCMGCHGPSFIPSRQWDTNQWNGAIDLMSSSGNVNFTAEERTTLVDWLVKNFGPDSKPRTLKFDSEMPVDETKISKAMYVEYYLTPGLEKRMGQDPHFDQQGYVWFTDRGKPPRLCRLDPRTGEIKEWKVPVGGSIHGLTIDADGVIWLPELFGSHLSAFNPKTETFEAYDFNPDHAKNVYGDSTVVDAKQNVWVSGIGGDRLIKWDRETKQIKVYMTPGHPSGPYGIDIDKDDNVWIAESHGPVRVAKFDSKTEKWTEYMTPTQPGRVRRISVDAHGTVWFGIFSSGKIAKLDPSSGKIIEIKVPQQFSQPYDIWPDSQDNMWFSDGGQGGALIKYSDKTGTFTYFPTPQVTDQPKIEITREGAIWYCPRSSKEPGVGVLYPDMTKITTLAAYYPEKGATITKSALNARK